MSDPQIKKIHQRWLQYQTQPHCPINKYKTSSERTVPESRYFVFFVQRWFASLLLWDCRNAHSDMDSWFLKPRLRAPTELIQVTADSLWWAFLCSSCKGKGTTATFSISFCPTAEQFPSTATCMTPHTAPVWFKWRNLSFLFTNWKSCTVQYLPELLSISALFSQHSYKHVLISTRDISACKDLVNTLKNNSCIIIVQIPQVSLLWQKKANSKFNETKQIFFSLFLSYIFYLH